MSKPIPYMQFYITDYLIDTMHLTTEQHGAYDLIIFNYWHNKKPLDESKLAGITKLGPVKWAENRDTLAEFFQITRGKWKHKRIENELSKVHEQAKRNRANGIKSGEARRNKRTKNEQQANDPSTVVQRAANDPSTDTPTTTEAVHSLKGENATLSANGDLEEQKFTPIVAELAISNNDTDLEQSIRALEDKWAEDPVLSDLRANARKSSEAIA